jgi:hypothetical protein
MTDSEKLQLIKRVLGTCYINTESFADHNLGMELAYLCLAISRFDPDDEAHNDECVDWSASNEVAHIPAVLSLFRNLFPPDDPVWKFIIT